MCLLQTCKASYVNNFSVAEVWSVLHLEVSVLSTAMQTGKHATRAACSSSFQASTCDNRYISITLDGFPHRHPACSLCSLVSVTLEYKCHNTSKLWGCNLLPLATSGSKRAEIGTLVGPRSYLFQVLYPLKHLEPKWRRSTTPGCFVYGKKTEHQARATRATRLAPRAASAASARTSGDSEETVQTISFKKNMHVACYTKMLLIDK